VIERLGGHLAVQPWSTYHSGRKQDDKQNPMQTSAFNLIPWCTGSSLWLLWWSNFENTGRYFSTANTYNSNNRGWLKCCHTQKPQPLSFQKKKSPLY